MSAPIHDDAVGLNNGDEFTINKQVETGEDGVATAIDQALVEDLVPQLRF